MRLNSASINSVLFLALLVGCNPDHKNIGAEETGAQAVTASSIEAFTSTLYAFGQSHGCATCHATRTSPLWLNADPATAYAFAKLKVDFTNPTVSVFANYAGNNHCNSASCNVAANIPVMQSQLTQWAEIELQQGASGPPVLSGTTLANPAFVTASLAIPNPLPLVTAGAPAVLRFDLSLLAPTVAALNGAVLEISVQSYNFLQNEYKVFNPRIVGNSAAVSLSGLHVYIRPAASTGLGIEDVNGGVQWSGVVANMAPTSLPAPLPTGPITSAPPLTMTSLAVQATSEADVITIGFAGIQ